MQSTSLHATQTERSRLGNSLCAIAIPIIAVLGVMKSYHRSQRLLAKAKAYASYPKLVQNVGYWISATFEISLNPDVLAQLAM